MLSKAKKPLAVPSYLLDRHESGVSLLIKLNSTSTFPKMSNYFL